MGNDGKIDGALITGGGGDPVKKTNLSVSVWLGLLRMHGLIENEVRKGLARDGITLPQFDVLAQLSRAGAGLTATELSRRLLVTAGNLTGIIRRLEADRLVRRETLVQDRRAARIALTPAGKRLVARLIPRHRRDLDRILEGVPRGVLRTLRTALGRSVRALERERSGREA